MHRRNKLGLKTRSTEQTGAQNHWEKKRGEGIQNRALTEKKRKEKNHTENQSSISPQIHQ
jgi:hypothetical protein